MKLKKQNKDTVIDKKFEIIWTDEHNQKDIIAGVLLFCIILGIFMFFIGFHNVDLMMNYGTIFNDLNNEYFCQDNQCLNIRDITDCNVYDKCPSYDRIYKNGIFQLDLALALLLIPALYGFLKRWDTKKK